MLKGVVVFLSFLVVLVGSSVAQTQAQQEWLTYQNQEGRFTIDYPSDWIVNEEPSAYLLYGAVQRLIVANENVDKANQELAKANKEAEDAKKEFFELLENPQG